MGNTRITLPAPTVERLRNLIEQRNRLNDIIELIVATAREAQNVPADYQLRNIDVGWQKPDAQQPDPA